jgi:hypothetical protein
MKSWDCSGLLGGMRIRSCSVSLPAIFPIRLHPSLSLIFYDPPIFQPIAYEADPAFAAPTMDSAQRLRNKGLLHRPGYPSLLLPVSPATFR